MGSITDRLREKQLPTIVEALEDQQNAFSGVSEALTSLEFAIVHGQGQSTILTPIPTETEDPFWKAFENTFYQEIESALASGTMRSDYNGFVTYGVAFNDVEGLKKVTDNGSGIPFTVSFVHLNDDLLLTSKKTKRKREYGPPLPEEEWYQPKGEEGDIITLHLEKKTPFKYSLLPLYGEKNGKHRDKFPGFRVPFIIGFGEFGEDEIETYVTSAPRTKEGPPRKGENKGHYIKTGVHKLFDALGQFEHGKDVKGFNPTSIDLEILQPGALYNLLGTSATPQDR